MGPLQLTGRKTMEEAGLNGKEVVDGMAPEKGGKILGAVV